MTWKAGDQVWVTAGGKTMEAKILMASPNAAALFLTFDGAIWSDGSMYAGSAPVLRDDAGIYRTLNSAQAEVTISAEPPQSS